MDDKPIRWTWLCSAAQYFGNAEGIVFHDGKVYFMVKKIRTLLILDLELMTYETELTGAQFEGKGTFNAQPYQWWPNSNLATSIIHW